MMGTEGFARMLVPDDHSTTTIPPVRQGGRLVETAAEALEESTG